MAPRRERVSTLPRLQLLVLLLLPLMLVPQPIAGHGGKYSREKNEPEMAAKRESGEEFRMEKVSCSRSVGGERNLLEKESIGDPEHISRNKEKYVLLEEKTKELGYKVKKHLQDLSSRVSRARHNEL